MKRLIEQLLSLAGILTAIYLLWGPAALGWCMLVACGFHYISTLDSDG